jgi:methionyl-tRNA synthetase
MYEKITIHFKIISEDGSVYFDKTELKVDTKGIPEDYIKEEYVEKLNETMSKSKVVGIDKDKYLKAVKGGD